MTQFIKKTILILLPLLLSVFLLEYGMRCVPNDYSFKRQILEERISSIRIWIFGSSHSYNGIRPDCFEKMAFNSSHVSQSLKYDAFIFNKYIDRADSLEWVILPLSYFSLPYDLEDSKEEWRIKNYGVYYNCPYYITLLKYHFEIIGTYSSVRSQIKRVVDYLRYGTNDIKCDSTGVRVENVKENRIANWWENGKERAIYHTYNLHEKQSTIERNLVYLQCIIEKCKERHVNVLLVTMPASRLYYDNIDSEQYEFMINVCQDFESRYPNVHHLNSLKDNRFDNDDFFDGDHLEKNGAEKYSHVIDEFIRQISTK